MDSSAKILVVDDAPPMCRIIIGMLEGLDFKDISVATSGEKALKLLGKKSFDLVLLDNNMSGMDGLEVLKTAKEKGLFESAVFVMITAYRSASSIQQLIQLGAKGYLVKPFTAHKLEQKLSSLSILP
ncbi:MAG: response regulator [Thiotrichales bacterium]|nr:response regulator [Thiotrichales bacterium]